MKKIGLLISAFFVLNVSYVYCQDTVNHKFRIMPSLLIGRDQNANLKGEINGAFRFNRLSKPFEAKIGIVYSKDETNFKDFEGLNYETYSIILEGSFYIEKYTSIGVRLTSDYNSVDLESQKKYNLTMRDEAPVFFTGSSLLGNIGYCAPIFKKRLYLRIQGVIGISSYTITNGIYFSTSSSNRYQEEQETYVNLVSSINIGLGFRIL